MAPIWGVRPVIILPVCRGRGWRARRPGERGSRAFRYPHCQRARSSLRGAAMRRTSSVWRLCAGRDEAGLRPEPIRLAQQKVALLDGLELNGVCPCLLRSVNGFGPSPQ